VEEEEKGREGGREDGEESALCLRDIQTHAKYGTHTYRNNSLDTT
jgi:hypothetical protein